MLAAVLTVDAIEQVPRNAIRYPLLVVVAELLRVRTTESTFRTRFAPRPPVRVRAFSINKCPAIHVRQDWERNVLHITHSFTLD
jgi:hypothetical protein